MYDKFASVYDKIYLGMKDYKAEAVKIAAFIQQHKRSSGKRLLDVACGTGLHLEALKEAFEVEGLDVNQPMLEHAAKRLPGVPLHHADMSDFHLERHFDVITCLFSSIGYVRTVENLESAVRCMADHLLPGGVLLIEPWFTPDEWKLHTVHGLLIDEPELKVARVNTSLQEGKMSIMDLHHLVGTPEKTEHFVEHHELGLFEQHEMLAAIEKSGLEAIHDVEGIFGRGLYIGRKTK
jgi:ubiquinone/menaquinone biosynthesis C-methylase UbiE